MADSLLKGLRDDLGEIGEHCAQIDWSSRLSAGFILCKTQVSVYADKKPQKRKRKYLMLLGAL